MSASMTEGAALNRREAILTGAAAIVSAADPSGQAVAGQRAPSSQQPPDATGPTAADQNDRGTPNLESVLTGKVAVVTGAARGIGRSIAVEFAANGVDVIGVDIAGPVTPVTRYPHATPADLEQTGKLVSARGRKFVPFTADIRNIGALREIARKSEEQFGGIDIVVADAGIQAFKPLLEMQDADWHDVIDVNLTGTANTIRAFAPSLVKRGEGRIIVLSSTQGRHGTKNGSAYSASKWGIIGLMKSAALELGQHKITVNAIIPGLIDTPMTRNEKRWSLAMGETMKNPPENPTEDQVVAARLPRSPLGEPWLKPDQVAPAAVFLASAGAAMVTGAVYDVTGGDSAHYAA
ncbi:MAG: SDR family NAD(P)-dependent oxidoreductase [Bryobacteraceae bacterium]